MRTQDGSQQAASQQAKKQPPSESFFQTPSPRWPVAIRPLAQRDFRLFWSASLISNIGTWMYLAAVGWLAEVVTDNSFLVSLTVSVGIIPLVFFSPLGGLLADRMPRIRLMILTVILQTLVAVGISVAYVTDVLTIEALMLFSLLNGCVSSLGAPVQQAIIPELLPPADLRNGIVMNSSQWNISRSVGPLVAGYLIAFWSSGVVFWVNAVTFLLMILLFSRMQPRPAPRRRQLSSGDMRPDGSPPGNSLSVADSNSSHAPDDSSPDNLLSDNPRLLADLAEGIRYARHRKEIKSVLSSVMVLSTMLAPIQWLVPVIARDIFKVEAGGFGTLAGSFGVGSVAGGIVLLGAGRGVSTARFITIGYLGLGICTALLAGAPNLIFGSIAMGLCGFFFVFVSSSLITMLQLLAGDEYRGRMMSLWMMLFGCLTPLAAIAHGALAEIINMRWLILADSGIIVLYLVVMVSRRTLARAGVI